MGRLYKFTTWYFVLFNNIYIIIKLYFVILHNFSNFLL